VHLTGLHRLSAVKRLLPHVAGATFFGPLDGGAGPALAEFALPAARLTLGLTAEAWRGYSGEGALLELLAASTLADADLVGVLLAFDPVIDHGELARESGLTPERVASALAVLAASGRVGWDAHDAAYFHRELPPDPDRVDKDNPRLAAAKRLSGAVTRVGASQWAVRSGGAEYRVRFDPAAGASDAACTCTWYLRHPSGRGPCKHVLAVQLEVNR
jgi:hypothetical protein